MSGFRFDPARKIIRTCVAPFTLMNDEGKIETRDITVEYYSLSTKRLKEMREAQEKLLKDNPTATLWHSTTMIELIHSLPELLDAKNRPHRITIEFLDSLDVRNLDSIRRAIEEDGRPKAQPEK